VREGDGSPTAQATAGFKKGPDGESQPLAAGQKGDIPPLGSGLSWGAWQRRAVTPG